MSNAVHRHTPLLIVSDSRGATVRGIGYWRGQTGTPVERRVGYSLVDVAAQQQQQWDPRLFERREQGLEAPPSQQVLASLSGKPLLTESADAGWRLSLPGTAGQVLERWDSRGHHWRNTFDPRVRPLTISEGMAQQPRRVAERFLYADGNDAGGNRCGQLIRHDDNAGSLLIPDYNLAGQPRSEVRHFLASLDLPDWPQALAEREALLEPGDGARTTFVHGPLQELLEQTDTLGNRQRWDLDQSGAVSGLTLQLAGDEPQPLCSDSRYNAFGQLELQTLGNGVTCQLEHDPADGRLQRLIARRPGRSPLQDLHYGYDPAGNVLRVEDRSQPVRHFANQRVDPVSTFRYDSLSQLTEASGREAAGAAIGPGLPDLAPSPGDTSRLLNYQQHYEYDASGNLLSLRHIGGQQSYSRCMAVAPFSNHALPCPENAAPENPRSGFDGNGNLLHLAPGQPLRWNALDQLHSVRQVSREGSADDEEHYRYAGSGLRVRKVTTRLVAGRMQRSEVRYLPGLELREHAGETLAVIVSNAGACALRCLRWLESAPDGIANPQLRYSLGDHLGSSTLELDGQARIISHEGFYPYGGSAWLAADSALEASYKVRRHCGKERDASGLYDYGLRYYAPWLMRWVSTDPAGDVDGPNRYRFVRNNPVTLKDQWGLQPDPPTESQKIYSIIDFSGEASSPGYTASLGPGMQLPESMGEVARFAFNSAWSAKFYIPAGSANQMGDLIFNNYISWPYAKRMDSLLGMQPTPQQNAAHALAAGVSRCDHYAAINVFLMASSPQWPGVPVYHGQKPGHSFALLGDLRVPGMTLVVDSWPTEPVVHPWDVSWNREGGGAANTNDTPRWPGDPFYAMFPESVAEVGSRFYQLPTLEDPNILIDEIQSDTDANKVHSVASTMSAPQRVRYSINGRQYDASAIPASMQNRTSQSITLANAARERQRQGTYPIYPRR